MAQSRCYQCGRPMAFAMVPLRIRAAAVLLGLFGFGLIAYTVILTVPLLASPDPMVGLELIISAILVVGSFPLIDPLFWLLGAAGLVLLSLVAKPYRSA
jgi:hypothetical protein